MIFRELATPEEWNAALELRNLYHWNDQVTVERFRAMYDIGRGQRFEFRHLGFEEGKPVAYAGGNENTNSDQTGIFWGYIGVDVHAPDAKLRAKQCWENIIQTCCEKGCTKLQTETRSSYPFEIEALTELGFESVMRLPFSGIQLANTHFERQEGVVSYEEFAKLHPDDWLRRLWRLEMDVCADLPLPYPFVESAYDVYAERVMEKGVDKRTKFLMLQGEEIVGLSQLWYSTDPRYAATGLTGSLRKARRQGVATKLKMHALAVAKEDGIEQVFTDNEENNPMYLLNQQLGFEKLFDYYVYSKNVG